jgi:signal transduction histidine kinase
VGDEVVLVQRLNRAVTVLDQAITSLRAYMKELRPDPTAESLQQGLEQLVADPRFKSIMDVYLASDLPADLALEPVETSHILAILGEGLSNAARHGQARKVEIKGIMEDGRLTLTVKDNGRGFDPNTDNSGYGLRNMRDRARLLGGELMIESEPGSGTEIRLTMPWRIDEGDNYSYSG